MPLVKRSSYTPPPFLGSGHVQTIFPTLFRNPGGISYLRERIPTPDGDFLDLDFSKVGAKKIAILSHGLGGDSRRAYVLGMVRAFNRAGWDALAWNFRGCGGEPNRSLKMTHSGATVDLETVIAHVKSKKKYREIGLIGFSLGGNLTLKYLGERGDEVDPLIKRAVAFSVPCHLESSAWKLARLSNTIYMARFLNLLRQYVRSKKPLFPVEMDDSNFHHIQTFKDFDERYVAPLHGFKSAEDYWTRSSSLTLLPQIRIPTLLVNAKNDPFLSPECYPTQVARKNPHLFLETPDSGGHVGFVSFFGDGNYWSERRALEFIGTQGCATP